MPDSVELVAVQPPCSAAHESAADWAARVRAEVARVELAAREERIRDDCRILGRKAVLSASPFDAPKTSEPRRNLRPVVACKDKERRIEALRQLVAFRVAYRDARLRFAAGDHRVLFPAGTYRLRLAAAARCAPFPIPIAA